MSHAPVIVGKDGMMLAVHTHSHALISDTAQTITVESFSQLVQST